MENELLYMNLEDLQTYLKKNKKISKQKLAGRKLLKKKKSKEEAKNKKNGLIQRS